MYDSIDRMTRLLLVLGFAASSMGCSIVQFSEFGGFSDWYIGPAGWDRTQTAKSRTGIRSDRPPIYGHFRMLEVIYQPSGGFFYPARVTPTNGSFLAGMEAQERANASRQTVTWEQEVSTEEGSHNAIYFDLWDAGALEILPYRLWAASDRSIGDKIVLSLLQPFLTLGNVSLACIRLPAYAIHDVAKLAVIPVAAAHYSSSREPD